MKNVFLKALFLFFSFSYSHYVYAYNQNNSEYSYSIGISTTPYSQSRIITPPDFLFWKARTKVGSGFTIAFEKRLLALNNYILLNQGASFSFWDSKEVTNFSHRAVSIASIFISGYFFFYQAQKNDFYIYSSIGGPSWMSKNTFYTTGFTNRFVFQNQLGIGAHFGENKNYNLGLRFLHYSNGDLFPINGGFDVPIAIFVGWNI